MFGVDDQTAGVREPGKRLMQRIRLSIRCGDLRLAGALNPHICAAVVGDAQCDDPER